MRRLQWWLGLVLLINLLLVSPAWGLNLMVNGTEPVLEVPPMLVKGRVLVPLRSVMENLNASVQWQSEEGLVVVTHQQGRIELKPGETTGRINGVAYPLDVPPQVVDGRMLIPLRFVSEALGAVVQWWEDTEQVDIWSGTRLNIGEVWGYYIDAQSLNSLLDRQELVTGVYFNSYDILATGQVEERVFFPQGLELTTRQEMDSQAMVFSNHREVLAQILGNQRTWPVTLESLIQWLTQRGYTGVHLDLEGVASEYRDQLTQFVAFLKEGLARQGYSLSLALPAKTKNQMGWFDAYDYPALGELADQVMLMAYDHHYAGGEAGPVAGLDWVEAVVAYATKVIPPQKIILGLGVYGYDWPQNGRGRVIDLSQAAQIRQSFPGEVFFDPRAYSPGFRYQDREGVLRESWYEDSQSIMGKLELVHKYHLQGVALWRLGIVPPEIWDVITY